MQVRLKMVNKFCRGTAILCLLAFFEINDLSFALEEARAGYSRHALAACTRFGFSDFQTNTAFAYVNSLVAGIIEYSGGLLSAEGLTAMLERHLARPGAAAPGLERMRLDVSKDDGGFLVRYHSGAHDQEPVLLRYYIPEDGNVITEFVRDREIFPRGGRKSPDENQYLLDALIMHGFEAREKGGSVVFAGRTVNSVLSARNEARLAGIRELLRKNNVTNIRVTDERALRRGGLEYPVIAAVGAGVISEIPAESHDESFVRIQEETPAAERGRGVMEHSSATCPPGIIEGIRSHFNRIILDGNDIEIMKALAEDPGNAAGQFAEDEYYREEVLMSLTMALPENIQDLWDYADREGMTDDDLTRMTDMVYEGLGEAALIMPEAVGTVVVALPEQMVSRNMSRWCVLGRLDQELKNVVRSKLAKDLAVSAELELRKLELDEKGVRFMVLLLNRGNVASSPMFKEAISFLFNRCSGLKAPDIKLVLEQSKAFQMETIRRNQRFDQMDFSHTILGGGAVPRRRKKEEKPQRVETAEGSFLVEGTDEKIKQAQINMELIDLLLGLDEESIPEVFTQSIFAIGQMIAPRSDRIRNIRDYMKMYLSLAYARDRDKVTTVMSLSVMSKLYMLLSEHVRILKRFRKHLEEKEEPFEERILRKRVVDVSLFKEDILRTFQGVSDLYERLHVPGISNGERTAHAREAISLIKRLFDKFFGELVVSAYPTVIDLDFVQVLRDIVSEPFLQRLLGRLNEINFDSCRLIEFMAQTLSGRAVLIYPYPYATRNILGFSGLDDPWEGFRSYFKAVENTDISGINRYLTSSRLEEIRSLIFVGTLEMMLFELLKNSVTNARFDAEKRTLVGDIHESFEETTEGYRYVIEDNNAGIEPGRMREIFNICVTSHYTDSADTAYEEFAGGGLGLSKVTNIVDMYGGRLRITSKVDGGRAHDMSYMHGAFSEVKPVGGDDALRNSTGTKVTIDIPVTLVDEKSEVILKRRQGGGGSREDDRARGDAAPNIRRAIPEVLGSIGPYLLRKVDGVDIDIIRELARKFKRQTAGLMTELEGSIRELDLANRKDAKMKISRVIMGLRSEIKAFGADIKNAFNGDVSERTVDLARYVTGTIDHYISSPLSAIDDGAKRLPLIKSDGTLDGRKRAMLEKYGDAVKSLERLSRLKDPKLGNFYTILLEESDIFSDEEGDLDISEIDIEEEIRVIESLLEGEEAEDEGMTGDEWNKAMDEALRIIPGGQDGPLQLVREEAAPTLNEKTGVILMPEVSVLANVWPDNGPHVVVIVPSEECRRKIKTAGKNIEIRVIREGERIKDAVLWAISRSKLGDVDPYDIKIIGTKKRNLGIDMTQIVLDNADKLKLFLEGFGISIVGDHGELMRAIGAFSHSA